MPKSILVGFDPRSADRAPVHFGVAASRFTGAPLIVAAVYADSVVVGQMGHGQMDEELAGDAAQPLDHVRRELRADGVRAEFKLLGGTSAPRMLHKAAEEEDVGLLVIGSTGRGRLGRALPGSTAERLIHGAPCPIAVVPRSWQAGEGLHTAGVAYTDTPEGNEALESALALASRAGAKLRILCAIKPRHFGRAAGGRPGAEVSTYDAAGSETEEVTREVLAEAHRRQPGLEVEADVSVQDAAEFLVAASEHVDLLVCGSRGYGPHRAVLLGGVSHKVIAAAHCPVIVLARGVDSGLRPLIDDRAGATA